MAHLPRDQKLLVRVVLSVLLSGVSSPARPPRYEGDTAAADIPRHSISGVSAGGGMVANHMFAFSSVLDGAAIIAGNAYGCGPVMGNATNGSCYTDQPPMDYGGLYSYTNDRAAEGLIDPLSNLMSTPLYLYGGTDDTIVLQKEMTAAAKFFAHYTSESKIQAVWNINSEHGYITDGFGSCCNCTGPPYFHNCNYDQAGAILKHIYGEKLRPRSATKPSSYQRISQANYAPTGMYTGMAAEGIAYVPAACSKNVSRCRMHVDYHGCIANHPNGVSVAAHHAGFSEWAESNAIILVFPAAHASVNYGCWDWTGAVVGPLFDTKHGAQLQTVIAMLSDLQAAILGPAPPPPPPPPSGCHPGKLKHILEISCAPWSNKLACEECAEAHAHALLAANCSNATTSLIVRFCQQ